ncbi:hypothetical protein TSMEX_004847 [Taenia solium]|eukprot:TsM_000470100 transcript=TsM_000470100 gene=TsM_000470100
MKKRGKTYLSRSVSAYSPVRDAQANRKASLDSGSSTSRSESSHSSASSSRPMGRSPPRRRNPRSQVRRTPPRNVSPNYSIDRMLASNPYMESGYPGNQYERALNRVPMEINGEPVYYETSRLQHLAKGYPLAIYLSKK